MRFERQGKELQVGVKDLSTVLRSDCSRCGAVFDQPVSISTVTAFVPIDGFDEDYPVHIDAKKAEANLSEWIRVEILAATDPLAVCREGCLGRCPTCGQDLNAGPCDCTEEEPPNPFKELGKYFKK